MHKSRESKKVSASTKKIQTNFKKDDWDCLGFMVVYYIIWTALIVSIVAIVVTG